MREKTLLRISPLLFLNEEVCTLGLERRLGSCSSRSREELGIWGRRSKTHHHFDHYNFLFLVSHVLFKFCDVSDLYYVLIL